MPNFFDCLNKIRFHFSLELHKCKTDLHISFLGTLQTTHHFLKTISPSNKRLWYLQKALGSSHTELALQKVLNYMFTNREASQAWFDSNHKGSKT